MIGGGEGAFIGAVHLLLPDWMIAMNSSSSRPLTGECASGR
jgi:hypothetical protein